jgi:hypothetical protein
MHRAVNAIRQHFRNWVMKGTEPLRASGPTLKAGDCRRDRLARGSAPPAPPADGRRRVSSTLLDYAFGPRSTHMDAGIQTNVPPPIKHVIHLKVPRVDADGNEIGGVPVVLRDAPLGTYLGWNITAAGFHKGHICNYAGGMVPFAKTKAERTANEDPRLSLEERYVNHAGYVAAVEASARKAAGDGFLLEPDAKALIAAADASDVLK